MNEEVIYRKIIEIIIEKEYKWNDSLGSYCKQINPVFSSCYELHYMEDAKVKYIHYHLYSDDGKIVVIKDQIRKITRLVNTIKTEILLNEVDEDFTNFQFLEYETYKTVRDYQWSLCDCWIYHVVQVDHYQLGQCIDITKGEMIIYFESDFNKKEIRVQLKNIKEKEIYYQKIFNINQFSEANQQVRQLIKDQ